MLVPALAALTGLAVVLLALWADEPATEPGPDADQEPPPGAAPRSRPQEPVGD